MLLGLFVASIALNAAEKKSDVTIDWGKENAPPADAPIPPPDPLDSRYSAEGLLTAFRVMAKQLGAPVRSVAVDTSEYPYLVHGVLAGKHSHQDMRRVLNSLPGYAYNGSTTMISTTMINSSQTTFVLNMNPSNTYPRDRRSAISQRMMPRLRALLNRELGR